MATITSTDAGATGRYIDYGSPSSQDDIGAQTIIAYVKPAAPSVIGYVFAKGDSSGNGPRLLQNTANALAFGFHSSGTSAAPSKVSASSAITNGTWQHWQCDWDGTLNASGINMYIDAGSALTGTTDTNGTGSVSSDASQNLFLMNRTGLGREFIGDVGYIARWNRVLNSTERSNVRTNGPLAEPSGLIFCFANDQDYSTNALTQSGRSTRVTGSTPSNTALGDVTTTISATVGNAVAAGVTATITTASDTTISATPGNAVAAGVTANIANISLEGAYERASVILASSTVVGAGDSAVISIAPKLQESEVTDTRWLEPSVDVVGVNGYRPTFRFLSYKDGSGGVHAYSSSAWTTSRRPMYSYDDGATWNYFDTAPTLDTVNQWVEFRHSTAFTGNRVRISRSRQITVHQCGDWLASLATTYSSFFGPSASAVSYTPTGSVSGFSAQSFIADEFSTQTDSLSNTVPVTPFYAAEINDTSLSPVGGHSKRLAMVTSGVHAGEDHGQVLFQRFVEYLCGSSTEAQALRRNYRILVYPLLNAPGRAGGGWRGSWTQGTAGVDDINRHFDDTGTTLEIIDKPKAVMTTDRASSVPDWFIDFHGTWDFKWSFIKDAADGYHTNFYNKLTSFSGVTVNDEGDSISTTVASYFSTLGAKLSVTNEIGDPSPVTDSDLTNYGSAMVQTLNSMMEDGVFFINAIPGDATAAGITATITTTGNTTISATTGNAVADGVAAGVTQTIANTVGDASAAGITAAVIRAIAGIPGDAVANGTTATITGTTVITATPGDAVAAGVDAQITSASSNDGDGGKSRKRYYLRRKGKILLFDTAAQADDYLEAEEEAQKAIQAAKSRGAKKRIAAKILKAVEPIESVEIAPLQELVKAYSVPVNLPQLLTQQDYQQVMDVRAMIQRIQDDEDDELLLLLA